VGRRLSDNVWLTVDNVPRFLAAGSEPTEAEAALIKNEKAWEDEPKRFTASPGESFDNRDEALDIVKAPPREALDIVKAPPRKGPGSSRAAWAAYATARGLDVPESADRDGIIIEVEIIDGHAEE